MDNFEGRKKELIKRINDAIKRIDELESKGILSFRKKGKPWNIVKIASLKICLNQLEQNINNSSEEEILNIYENWLEDIETIIYILLEMVEIIINVMNKKLHIKPQPDTTSIDSIKKQQRSTGGRKS